MFAGRRRLFPRFADLMLAVGCLVVVLGALNVPASEAASGEESDHPEYVGVVVEEVGKGSALEKAGLQSGDVLYAWERLASPPANPEAAQGEFKSPFDWQWIEIEQAPRGKVILTGQREGEEQFWVVEPGIWATKVRPAMSEPLVNQYLQWLEQIQVQDIGVEVKLSEEFTKTAKGIECWILLRLGGEWAAKRNWVQAERISGSPQTI